MRCLHFPIAAQGKGEEARASGGKGGFQFPAILAVVGMGWEGVVRGRPIPAPYLPCQCTAVIWPVTVSPWVSTSMILRCTRNVKTGWDGNPHHVHWHVLDGLK